MNRFAVDATNSGGWVERTFDGKRAHDASVRQWIFGEGGLMEALTVGTWDKLLRYSAPLFQLAEGFCSLLLIQAAGQITRWLVNRGGRSDTWMVLLSLPNHVHDRKLTALDCTAGDVSLDNFKLGVLPMANHQLPGHWQC